MGQDDDNGKSRFYAYKQPRWAKLLKASKGAWEEAAQRAARQNRAPRVLVATSLGGHVAMTPVESMLAVALTLRGARVEVFLCDEAVPACQLSEWQHFPDFEEFAAGDDAIKPLCATCYAPGRKMYEELGLPIRTLGGWLTAEERAEADRLAATTPFEEISSYTMEGVGEIGEQALAGALRFFAVGELKLEPTGEAILRKYFKSALLAGFAIRRGLREGRYDVAVFHHGIYTPQGVIGEACRRAGVRVVNWVVAYRQRHLIFSHDDTYHRTMALEPTSLWEDMPWTPDREEELMDYLQSRHTSKNDWIKFHTAPLEEAGALRAELGLDAERPLILALTNVFWDAQLHYRQNAFPNLLVWVLETIEYFRARPDLQLAVRIHPAEVKGSVPSRQLLEDEITRHFGGNLPENVKIIGPAHPASTYTLGGMSDAVLIYGTKTGVELTTAGIPVIVGGEAWIRGKGVTDDAQTREGYFQLLDRLPYRRRLDSEKIARAKKYAYHFFFRRMVPVPFLEPRPHGSWPPFQLQLERLEELGPDTPFPGLEVLCRGILGGPDYPFIYEPLEPMKPLPAVKEEPAVLRGLRKLFGK
jgi:hypothetical protein